MATIMTRKWVVISIIVILSVLAYLVFTLIFIWLFARTTDRAIPTTPTPIPTFTPTPSVTPLLMVANSTATTEPSLSATSTATPPTESTATPTATPNPLPTNTPNADHPANLGSHRSQYSRWAGDKLPGAGTTAAKPAYPGHRSKPERHLVAGPASQRRSRLDCGLGGASQRPYRGSGSAGSPTAAPRPRHYHPTATPLPQFQYEPTGWFGDTNYGLTRFLGTIVDAAGNPVNGVSVELQCGGFRIISNPSGPVGWPPFYDSATDPPGFYDITLDRKPIPCKWFLTIVESPDGKTVSARLSDAVEVETTVEESIITANWRKNW